MNTLCIPCAVAQRVVCPFCMHVVRIFAYSFCFLLTDLFFNKSICNARLVCVCEGGGGGGGGYVSIKLRKYFQA